MRLNRLERQRTVLGVDPDEVKLAGQQLCDRRIVKRDGRAEADFAAEHFFAKRIKGGHAGLRRRGS